MRVHLGSDHAGLELKDHLLNRLVDQGHEVVDHGPFIYDAVDDYPVFCLRAAEAVVADRADGAEALGVVIGGSGNGEQIAANKVEGVRCALAWSEETATLARQHNDANVISVGGRMHSVEDMSRFVEVFLATPFSEEERHLRRIAQLTMYKTARELTRRPNPRSRALRFRAWRRCLRATPSTGSPTTCPPHSAGECVRVSSPQGRFAADASQVDGSVLNSAESAGKHLFLEFSGERFIHVHLGLIGKFDVHTGIGEVPNPVGQVRLRLVSTSAYADLRGAHPMRPDHGGEAGRDRGRVGP